MKRKVEVVDRAGFFEGRLQNWPGRIFGRSYSEVVARLGKFEPVHLRNKPKGKDGQEANA